MSLGFRPVEPTDADLLFALYASTRSAEMAVVPWDEAQKHAFLQLQVTAQERHYWEKYPTSEHRMIELGEQPVGRLWLDRQAERIHILDLTILPEARGAGVGTALLQSLQAEAVTAGKAVTIYVESFNPSLQLLERLGFAKVGEQGAHLLLSWRGAPILVK